jgi:lipopolysaccharide export system protein LptA
MAAIMLILFPLLPLSAANTLTYSGDSMTTVLSEGKQRAVLTGHARVQTEDTTINADRIELYGKDFIYALCTGSVKVVNTKKGMELTSEQLFYDRQAKIARINGNAVMTDLKNQLVVKGGFIEDRDSEQLTVVQIGVRILKADSNLVCRAEFARYYRGKKTLELSGMPVVTKNGDRYEAARITVNLDTEDINLEGNVKGEVKTQEKTPEKGGEASSTTPPAAASASPTDVPMAQPAGVPATQPAAPSSQSPSAPPQSPPSGQSVPSVSPSAPQKGDTGGR